MQKKIMLLIFTITVFTAAIVTYLNFNKDDYGRQITIVKLPYENGHSPLFIKRMNWGLTGDKQVIVVSNMDDKNFVPHESSEYVYNGLTDIYYKLQHDTLFIYTPIRASTPPKLITPYTIIQVELSNPELMNLIENDKYKQIGLKKI